MYTIRRNGKSVAVLSESEIISACVEHIKSQGVETRPNYALEIQTIKKGDKRITTVSFSVELESMY